MAEWWLWLYVAAMVAGLLLFMRWRADPQGVPDIEYRVAMAIPLWSGIWYLVMVLGGGRTEITGQTVYWGRYVDWVVTAPLLLVALALTGTHSLPGRRRGLVTTLVGATVVMVLSGLAADLMRDDSARFVLYGIGMVALAAVYGMIWVPLRIAAHRQPAGLATVYTEAAMLLSVLWAGYPLLWILGPSGVGLIGSVTDTALFVVLSILSKVGWSIVDLGRLRALARRGQLTVK